MATPKNARKPTDCRLCKNSRGKKVEVGDNKFRTEWICDILQRVIWNFEVAENCPHI